MNLSDCTHVFYVPGSTSIIDCAWQPEGQEEFQTAIFATPFSEVQRKHPEVKILTWEEVEPMIMEAAIALYVSPPKVITEERFNDMLEILPPMRWKQRSGAESFMISEALTHNIRSIFCRIGDTHYEMCDVDSLSHDEIVEKCKAIAG
jgi:hypothetical protein